MINIIYDKIYYDITMVTLYKLIKI